MICRQYQNDDIGDNKYQDKIMSRTDTFTKGPKCFGTMKRTSFVDERDDDIPGPGAHNMKRFDKHPISQWKFGKVAADRGAFLRTPSRKSPSPCHYQPHFQTTRNQGPLFTIPKSEVENPSGYKTSGISAFDYQSDIKVNKPATPKFSFGYNFKKDYSTPVPASNVYCTDNKHIMRQHFNKTQCFFTKSKRPLPYGQEFKNPGTGAYDLNKNRRANSAVSSFGTSDKSINPKVQGNLPARFYQIAHNLKQPGKGWTMRPFYQKYVNKDKQFFPGPSNYNPKYIDSRKRIVTLTGKRSQLWNKDHVANPSPQKHAVSQNLYKKKIQLSFTKQTKGKFKPKDGPGPAKYNVEKELSKYKGYMGKKIKDLEKFNTPSSASYKPAMEKVKPNAPNIINYQSNRCDFSKSVTGILGPGKYDISKNNNSKQLGKMSKSLKFAKNNNKNPGPGFYDIPSSIGKLPKYYTAQKKLTEGGFSTYALEFEEKHREREEQAKEAKKLREMKEEEEAKIREEQQALRREELQAKKAIREKETD